MGLGAGVGVFGLLVDGRTTGGALPLALDAEPFGIAWAADAPRPWRGWPSGPWASQVGVARGVPHPPGWSQGGGALQLLHTINQSKTAM